MPIDRAAVLALALLAAPVAAQEVPGDPDTFHVGAGDRLRIDFYFQPELSRIYPVRPGGEIALHLLGTLQVDGLTIAQVEDRLRERMQETFQSTQTSVIVEMEQFRDVYVQGAVSEPGAFPYSPGLTVVQAVALAGGTGNAGPSLGGDMSASDLNRILEKQRDLSLTQARIAQEQQRLARIEAQLGAGGDGEAAGDGDSLSELGTQIVETRIHGYELQRDLAEAEAEVHARNREILMTRLERAEGEVERLSELNSRGLVRADALQDVEERADRLRSELLDVTAEAARADRTRSDAENAAELARLDYREDLLREREQAETALRAAQVEMRADEDALRRLGSMPQASLGGGDVRQSLSIARMVGDRLETFPAAFDTPMLPGDVLSVVTEIGATQ